jgi:hypothetical protein
MASAPSTCLSFAEPGLRRHVQRLRVTAAPLPFAELFAAMESGAVDGQENPINTIQSCKFYEVQKHLSLTRHVYSPWLVTASERWWRSLSQQERSAVDVSAQAARDFEREDSRRSAAQALDFLNAQGMQVTDISDRELRRMREGEEGAAGFAVCVSAEAGGAGAGEWIAAGSHQRAASFSPYRTPTSSHARKHRQHAGVAGVWIHKNVSTSGAPDHSKCEKLLK